MSQRENSKNHFGFESVSHLYRRPYMTSFDDHSKNMAFHIIILICHLALG